MFESLDEEAVRRVRPWHAPPMGRVAPPSSATLQAASTSGSRPAVPIEPPVTTATAFDAVSEASAGAAAGIADSTLQRRFEEGRLQGLAEAQAGTRERAIDEAAMLLGALARERDTRDALLENELLALARAMARLIVRRELEHDVGMMRGVVREALARLPSLSDTPLVRLHPIDAEAVRARMSDTEAVTIVADETLARGDCHVESGATLIDAGIDAWVGRIGARHGLLDPIERLVSSGEPDEDMSNEDPSDESTLDENTPDERGGA